MNNLNSDYIKLRSTDPTGAIAAIAVLFLVAAPFLTAYGVYKAGEAAIHQLSPHHPVAQQAVVHSAAAKSQPHS